MYRYSLLFFLFLSLPLQALDYQKLLELLAVHAENPIHDELNIHVAQGKTANEEVLICCHGYGGDYRLGYALQETGAIDAHIVSFNFPDFGPELEKKEASTLSFGTIYELLPLIYVIKECVLSGEQEKVHLYGFSAGGGAIINALSILSRDLYDDKLKMIGVDRPCKEKLLSALQAGHIILDCPLKSVEEIIADRGLTPQLQAVQEKSILNQLRPIDSLQTLDTLTLNVLLHFQKNDRVLSNRDDALYIDRLQKANHKGQTLVVVGEDGGHKFFQPSLKEAYARFK